VPLPITLIGMPGSGKSTVGRLLADWLGVSLVDVDDLINRRHGTTVLGDVLTKLGREKFLDAEADEVCRLPADPAILSPGGSVIYRQRAIDHLRRLGPIVYLRLTLADLTPRLGDLAARGVAGNEGGLPGLFDERTPLYTAAATHTVDAAGTDPAAVMQRVLDAVV
jgi:shikimate kinase